MIDSPKDCRGKVSANDPAVTLKRTVQRHTNDVRCGRAVGGGVPTVRADIRGMSAVGALSTSANNGAWGARITRNPKANRAAAVTPSRTGRAKFARSFLSPAELAERRAASPAYATA